MKIPLAGSLANVCTEFRIPDLTRKVPIKLRENVRIDKRIVHDCNIFFFSKIFNAIFFQIYKTSLKAE